MNFWCSLFTNDYYHAQFYLPTAKKKPASIDHSQIRQQENPQINRRSIRIFSKNATSFQLNVCNLPQQSPRQGLLLKASPLIINNIYCWKAGILRRERFLALTKNYNLQNETSTKETKESFFKQVLGFCELQYVMCTGTDPQEHRMIQLQGSINIKISPSHYYCIQNLYEENGKSMVRIYNPWGLKKDEKDNDILGRFDLTWDQYVTDFHYLAIAKVRDNANYLFTELKNCEINQFTFIELNIFNKFPKLIIKKTPKECLYDSHLHSPQMQQRPENQNLNLLIKNYQIRVQILRHYLQLADMMEGKYLICIYFSNADGIKQNLNFGVYSQDNFGIKQKHFPKQMHHLILEQVLISYHYKSPSERIALTNRKDAWYSFNVTINNSIFGYILLHTGTTQKDKEQIQAGGKAFKQANLTVMKPYDIEEILIAAQPGHETIAIVRIDNLSQYIQRQNEYVKMGKNLHKERIQIKQFK